MPALFSAASGSLLAALLPGKLSGSDLCRAPCSGSLLQGLPCAPARCSGSRGTCLCLAVSSRGAEEPGSPHASSSAAAKGVGWSQAAGYFQGPVTSRDPADGRQAVHPGRLLCHSFPGDAGSAPGCAEDEGASARGWAGQPRVACCSFGRGEPGGLLAACALRQTAPRAASL